MFLFCSSHGGYCYVMYLSMQSTTSFLLAASLTFLDQRVDMWNHGLKLESNVSSTSLY
jgi:hypothetical protein